MSVKSIFARDFNTNLLGIERTESCPRIFNIISKKAKDLAHHISSAIQSIFIALGQIRADACAFGRSLRFTIYTLFGIEKYLGKPGLFGVFTGKFSHMDGFVDTINVLDSIHYFVTGKQRNDNIGGIIGNLGFLASGGLGLLLFLDEMTIMNLSSVSARFGSLFGLVTRLGVTLTDLTIGAVAIGYAGLGVSAIIRLIRAELASAKDKDPAIKAREKAQAWLDLAWSVSEVALKVFILAGCTSLIGLVVLGTIATGFGIASFLHSKQEAVDPQPQLATPKPKS